MYGLVPYACFHAYTSSLTLAPRWWWAIYIGKSITNWICVIIRIIHVRIYIVIIRICTTRNSFYRNADLNLLLTGSIDVKLTGILLRITRPHCLVHSSSLRHALSAIYRRPSDTANRFPCDTCPVPEEHSCDGRSGPADLDYRYITVVSYRWMKIHYQHDNSARLI